MTAANATSVPSAGQPSSVYIRVPSHEPALPPRKAQVVYAVRQASRARELVDQGTPVTAACRIISLEDQLAAHTDADSEASG